MSNQLRSRYDIIINGGGIVGFTLLNLIQKSPHLSKSRVLLIEQAKKPTSFKQPPRHQQSDKINQYDDQIMFSNRVSSVTLASKTALKDLGLWNNLRPFVKDVKSIRVWSYDYSHKIIFRQQLSSDHKDQEESDIVFSTVENNRLSCALLESIHKNPDASDQIAWNCKLQHLDESQQDGSVNLRIEDNETGEEQCISADLILGCDGFKSKVRGSAEMSFKELDLNKTAVVGTVRMSQDSLLSRPDNDVAYQKFSASKDTVCALLPVDNNFSSFVLSAPNEYAKFLADCDEETFVNEFNQLLLAKEYPANPILNGAHQLLNSAYDSLHGLLQVMPTPFRPKISTDIGIDEPPSLEHLVRGSRASFPLVFSTTSPKMIASISSSSRQPQIALLGDATHRVHPLAGQGLNLGIQDAIELAKQLEVVAKTGERLFEDKDMLARVLKRYELKRQAYIIPMSVSILAMQQLFKLAPSRMLSSLNKCEPVKRASVRVANGCM